MNKYWFIIFGLILLAPTINADNFILESNLTKINNTLDFRFGNYHQIFDLTLGDFNFVVETIVPTNTTETFLLKFDDVNQSITNTVMRANDEERSWFQTEFLYQINKSATCESDLEYYRNKNEFLENNVTNVMNFGLKNCEDLADSEREQGNIYLIAFLVCLAGDIVLLTYLFGAWKKLQEKIKDKLK